MSEEQSKAAPTRAAKPKDPVFKRLLQSYFEEEHLTDTFAVTPGVQVGQLHLEIDVLISATKPATNHKQIQAKLANTPFWFFNLYNLVEFKSSADLLDEADFAKITARALLAWSERPQAARSEVLSCIVSASWPRELLKQLRPGGRPFEKIRPGLYFHPGFLFPIYLVVCNLLPIEESNYPLLVFSSGNKLKSYLERLINEDLQMYLNYVVRMHPTLTTELVESMGGVMTAAEKKLINAIYNAYEPEELAEKIGMDTVIKVFGLERLLESVGPDRLAEALKKKLTPEQRERLREQLKDEN